ncbi:unnamed protein product [Penicillium pancosmium]
MTANTSRAVDQDIDLEARVSDQGSELRCAYVIALVTDVLLGHSAIYQLPNPQTRTYLMVGENHVTALGKAWLSASVAAKLGCRPALGPAVAAFKVGA